MARNMRRAPAASTTGLKDAMARHARDRSLSVACCRTLPAKHDGSKDRFLRISALAPCAIMLAIISSSPCWKLDGDINEQGGDAGLWPLEDTVDSQ